MKNEYIVPNLELIKLNLCDVITSSNETDILPISVESATELNN